MIRLNNTREYKDAEEHYEYEEGHGDPRDEDLANIEALEGVDLDSLSEKDIDEMLEDGSIDEDEHYLLKERFKAQQFVEIETEGHAQYKEDDNEEDSYE